MLPNLNSHVSATCDRCLLVSLTRLTVAVRLRGPEGLLSRVEDRLLREP